jgi:hypothetical protein
VKFVLLHDFFQAQIALTTRNTRAQPVRLFSNAQILARLVTVVQNETRKTDRWSWKISRRVTTKRLGVARKGSIVG